MNILIDNEKLVVVKNTPTVEQAILWADIECPQSDFTVVGDDTKHYGGYTDYELSLLLKNSGGHADMQRASRQTIIERIIEIADKYKDATPQQDLEKRLKLKPGELPTIDHTPSKTTSPKGNPTKGKKTQKTAVSVEQKRPKAGTVTGRIWEIIDELSSSGELAPKQDVLEKALAEGNKKATVNTQYSRYKKWYYQKVAKNQL